MKTKKGIGLLKDDFSGKIIVVWHEASMEKKDDNPEPFWKWLSKVP